MKPKPTKRTTSSRPIAVDIPGIARGSITIEAPRGLKYDLPRESWIPEQWTFNNAVVASHFEAHVRQQLPWYDTLLISIAHFGAHYIPEGGLVYDIGASTGNVGLILAPTLKARKARLVAIERSEEMAKRWVRPPGVEVPTLWTADALTFDFAPFDFGVMNLALMFMPVAERAGLVRKLCDLVRPGGAFVMVEKVTRPAGYLGTVMGRLAMKWKVDGGTSPEEVLAKELSLAGVQRPINPAIIPAGATRFFQFGEFVGWIYEREERGTD